MVCMKAVALCGLLGSEKKKDCFRTQIDITYCSHETQKMKKYEDLKMTPRFLLEIVWFSLSRYGSQEKDIKQRLHWIIRNDSEVQGNV